MCHLLSVHFDRIAKISPGQRNLGQACPICLHEPVEAEDCKPNRALRTTVKVWLKKRHAEREAASRREMASRTPAVPATPVTPALEEMSSQQITLASITPNASERPRSREASDPQSAAAATVRNEEQNAIPEAKEDIPQPSIEVGSAPICAYTPC